MEVVGAFTIAKLLLFLLQYNHKDSIRLNVGEFISLFESFLLLKVPFLLFVENSYYSKYNKSSGGNIGTNFDKGICVDKFYFMVAHFQEYSHILNVSLIQFHFLAVHIGMPASGIWDGKAQPFVTVE